VKKRIIEVTHNLTPSAILNLTNAIIFSAGKSYKLSKCFEAYHIDNIASAI